MPSQQIFFLNKEVDVQNTIKNATDLQEVFQTYIQKFGEPTYLVIDEIQDIIDRERFIRAIYVMKKYHIIITGSNAHLLSGELATYLSGRYVSLEVYPL
ncbi:MAG: AAA family ATPase [Candidatus Peribacteria bacterium]|nr:AAA family ATPase [Candidatus Peribacteria bacterium]